MRFTMRLPSERVWIVSVTASPEYGAPFTTFPPKLSEAMNTKLESGGGGGPPSGPCITRCLIMTLPSDPACCANATLAKASDTSVAPIRNPDSRFIFSFLSTSTEQNVWHQPSHRPRIKRQP